METYAYKYRLYPSSEQAVMLAQHFGCSRSLYNMYIAWWKEQYQQYKQTGKPHDKIPLVTQFSHKFEYFKSVDSLSLMNARRHFIAALNNFFREKDNGQPKFKKKGVSKDTYSTNRVKNNIVVANNHIRLPKIGDMAFKKHRELPNNARILSATVSREKEGKYYVSIGFETNGKCMVKPCNTNIKVVGLDMSLSEFVVPSDEIDHVAKTTYVRNFRRYEKRYAKLSRRVSKKQRGSKNKLKARERLATLSQHIANRRKDYVIKTALHYARNYDVIVLEDIDMKDMSQALHLGKSVMDLGFGEFKQWLEWECKKYGTAVFYVDKWYASSKTCNHCGYVNKGLKLSDRQWICPECGGVIDRDYNAACNLRDYFLKLYREYNSTSGTGGSHACGNATSTLRETVKQIASMKQETAKSLV